LGILHLNPQDTQNLNFKILANTTMLVNIWAIGHDLKVWKNPSKFDLDQIFGSNINIKRSNYNLLPFGSGR
jgi:cytochrome P450